MCRDLAEPSRALARVRVDWDVGLFAHRQVRRREQKEQAEAAESERIAEIQDEVQRTAGTE